MQQVYDRLGIESKLIRTNSTIVAMQNENEFLISTVMGNVNIKGNNLELIKLDTNDGNICIKGKINSLTYSDSETSIKKNKNILSKIFK